MVKYNSKVIAEYLSKDLKGKKDYLLNAKKHAHKEIYHHLYLFKKQIGPNMLTSPDKVFPELSKNLYKVAIALRKVGSSSSILAQFMIDSLEIAKENYHKAPNDFLKELILELEGGLIKGFGEYFRYIQSFRLHLPISLCRSIEQNQIFPSKEVLEFLKALERLEEIEKELSKKVKHFFKKYKGEMKELMATVKLIDKGQIGLVGKYASSHPPTTVGTICLLLTVVGYGGVFITLGYGVAAVIGGGSLWSSIFGVLGSGSVLKKMGRLFFSSGTSVVSIMIDKATSWLS